MKNYKVIAVLVLALGLFLAACTSRTVPTQPAVVSSTPENDSTPESGTTGTRESVPIITPSAIAPQQNAASSDLKKTDSQGAVTFEVKPINLDNPGNALVFDVSMNTHSVDLGMDLATLADLTTDNGLTIQATQWDAAEGGHHVEGKLIFSITSDGKSLLKTAKELTLTIKNVDAPTRIFNWQLTN